MQNKVTLHYPRKSVILLLLVSVLVMHVHCTHTHMCTHIYTRLLTDSMYLCIHKPKIHKLLPPRSVPSMAGDFLGSPPLGILFSQEGPAKMLLPLAALTFHTLQVALRAHTPCAVTARKLEVLPFSQTVNSVRGRTVNFCS